MAPAVIQAYQNLLTAIRIECGSSAYGNGRAVVLAAAVVHVHFLDAHAAVLAKGWLVASVALQSCWFCAESATLPMLGWPTSQEELHVPI